MGLTADLNLFTAVIKVTLAILTVLFFLSFYIKWGSSKRGLPMLLFYTRWKIAKNNFSIGLGMCALALAFILDFLILLTFLEEPIWRAAANVLEVLALVLIGYSFYKIMRVER